MLRLFLPRIFQAHQLQKLRDAVEGGQSQNEILLAQVVLSGHIQIDGGGLHHRAHPAAGPDDVSVTVFGAVQGKTAGGGLLQSADQADQGCLARAVAAHKAVDGALGNVHGQTAQGFEVAVLLSEILGGQNVFHSKSSPLW